MRPLRATRNGRATLSSFLAFVALATGAMMIFAAPESAANGDPDGDVEFFERRVRPLLIEHCESCHGPEKQKAGLRLDSRAGWSAGGDGGPVVIPGDPAGSRLIHAVRYEDEALRMPPKTPLSAAEVEVLMEWVRRGAPDPRTTPTDSNQRPSADAARDFWAFQPRRQDPPPSVRNTQWPQGDLDRFILAALEERNLRPGPRASRRELIRRASFDLTGLPPTSDEIDAFEADPRPDPIAFAELVERWLASPRYGERWGRWWLDVARYADTNGQDENKVMANAWRYRDWVIAAFNANKPIDQFITEQLAGDLLPEAESERETLDRRIATGFLVLGPKMLAEQDKPKLVMDIVDEQIDTVGRAFLGLTLGCARCHDHKFDPIPARDYYAVAGIFKSTRTMENLDFVSKFNERAVSTSKQIAAHEEHRRRYEGATNRLGTLVREAKAAVTASGQSTAEDPRPFYSEATRREIEALEQQVELLKASAPPAPEFALSVAEDQPVELPIHLRGSHLQLAKDPVPRGFIRVVESVAPGESIPKDASGRLQFARWITSPENPLTARVMVNRVWQAFFGVGLVRTADNFGFRGEPPTHPELLDWLATTFIASGWDLKSLQRAIVNSATYQRSSRITESCDPCDACDAPTDAGPGVCRDAEDFAQSVGSEVVEISVVSESSEDDSGAPVEMASGSADADPENRFLRRFPRRRLDAEMIRDALLAVSGRLDDSMGGCLTQWTNNDYVPGDSVSSATTRRTVYLPIVRDRVFDALTLFDFANPSVITARRTPTVVSQQALFFLNSPLVREAAGAVAGRIHAQDGLDEAGRVIEAYSRILGRAPRDGELSRAVRFLDSYPARLVKPGESAAPESSAHEALDALCHALLASNEFIYLP